MTSTASDDTSRPLRAVGLCCSLKGTPTPSSSSQLGQEVLDALGEHGVSGEMVRVVDHDVHFGVSTDEGDGDAWPEIRARILASDVVVLAVPIWMGQPSSVAKMVMERLDAELAETDDEGRTLTLDKVAVVAVVGNEDGAHHVTAELLQALNDTGFTIAANAATYWVGEAMQAVDYQDHDTPPETTAATTRAAAAQAAHLARALRAAPYPPL